MIIQTGNLILIGLSFLLNLNVENSQKTEFVQFKIKYSHSCDNPSIVQ